MNKAIEMPGDGQTMVELGLILALISIVAIAVLFGLGQDINKKFQEVQNGLNKKS